MKDFFSKTAEVPIWIYYSLILFLWVTILTDLWDYFSVSRPIEQCMKAKQTHCPVNGKDLYIEYKS